MNAGNGNVPSSPDFGDFHSAPRTVPDNQPRARLDETDLLGSFDDVEAHPSTGSTASSAATLDLLSDDIHTVHGGHHRHRSVDSSPTRSRHKFSVPFPGPSSPPRVSDAGGDIIFHAPAGAENAVRRIRRMSSDYSMMGPSHDARPTRGIVDTLAVSKLANKWKRSMLNNNSNNTLEPEPPTKTAMPIDISHSSPFASRDQLMGSYVPPEGAPGFRPTGLMGHDNDDEWLGCRLDGRKDTTTPVLSVGAAQQLHSHLPARQRLSDSWRLLFSLDQHGASLSTLYRQVEKYAKGNRMAGNVLVARDMDGNTFGVYLNEPILKREGTYYGSGESFLFKFADNGPKIFRWTGKNQYIALCETSFISFGGGGAGYGLLFDATFSRNSSATSPAFQNEILCAGQVYSEKPQGFDCLGLEVWATS